MRFYKPGVIFALIFVSALFLVRANIACAVENAPAYDNDLTGDGSLLISADDNAASNLGGEDSYITFNVSGDTIMQINHWHAIDPAANPDPIDQVNVSTTTINNNVILGGAFGTAVTVNGALNMTQGNINNVQDLEVEGNATVGGTLGVTDLATLSGGATISGGDTTITSDSALNALSITDAGVSLGANGKGLGVLSDGSFALQGTGAAGLGVNAAGTSVTLLNNVNGGHGLTIGGASTTLTGGTNSSSFVLQDGSATLSVGTAAGPEIQVLQATDVAGVTDLSITTDTTSIASATSTEISGDNANLSLTTDSASLGVTAGSTFTATDTSLSALTSDGYGLSVDNTAGIALQTTDGAGLSIGTTGTDITLLNNVGAGHGLTITGTATTLSGGTASSDLVLQDGSATISVGTTGGGSEVQVFRATNVADSTAVTIGGTKDASNSILATAANGVNNLTANAMTGTNNIEAKTNNIGVATSASVNVIGYSGAYTSTNTIQGSTNTIIAGVGHSVVVDTTTTTVKGSETVWSGNGTGSKLAVTAASVAEVSADGFSSSTVANNSVVLIADIDANGTTSSQGKLSLTDTTAGLTVRTNAGVAHGLSINQTSATLSGGTNSSSLVLQDASATISVGTAGSSEIQVFQATNTAGATSVTIGGAADVSNTIQGATNTIIAAAGHSVVVNATTTTVNGTGTIWSGAGTGNHMTVDAASSRFVSSVSGGQGNNGVVVANNTGTYQPVGEDPGLVSYGAGGNSITVDNTREAQVGVNTFTYGTQVEGGMLINGDLGVNGNIYTLNNLANATINIGQNGMNIVGADNEVSLQAQNTGEVPNGLGKLDLTPTGASLLVTNTDTLAPHGITIGQTETVVSGGTHSTKMTLNDSGATFANEQTGAPTKVTGVADATGDYDAVNYRQYKALETRADAGIASVAALAAIPAPAPGKNYAIGAGTGVYRNQSALALGVKANVGKQKNIGLSAGLGYSHADFVANAGVSWSF